MIFELTGNYVIADQGGYLQIDDYSDAESI